MSTGSKIRVLLVDVTTDFSSSADFSSRWIYPPLGLMSLSAYLKKVFKDDEIEVRILDLGLEDNAYHFLGNSLDTYNPDVVGLRGFSHTSKQFHQALAIVKEHNPNTYTIGGGPYIHSESSNAIKDPNLDAACTQEGELVLAELISQILSKKRNFAEVKGLIWKSGDKTYTNPAMPFIQDLDILPYPDYNDIEIDRYIGRQQVLSALATSRRYAVMFTSRGCPHQCNYCHSIFGKKFRHRSPENIAGEFKQLNDKWGITDFVIKDDIFNNHLPHAKEVLRQIAALKLNFRISFSNGLRGDNVDEEFIDLMVKAGVVETMFAIETPTLRLQELTKKRLKVDRVEEVIRLTSEKGIIVGVFFMLGFPGETQEELNNTFKFIHRNLKWIDFPILNSVKAYTGTSLYDFALQLGYSKDFLAEQVHVPLGIPGLIKNENMFLSSDLLLESLFEISFLFFEKERITALVNKMRRIYNEDEIISRFQVVLRDNKEKTASFLRKRMSNP